MRTYSPPPDKSITLRALLLGASAAGQTFVGNPLLCDDTRAALRCLKALGVKVRAVRGGLELRGVTFRKPRRALDAGGSGTTARLLAGLLAGLPFPSALTGNAQLKRRPMERVTLPLQALGAKVVSRRGRLPISFSPAALRGAAISSPVASAQVKSAVLLAALGASGPTAYTEPHLSRDHTERLFSYFGARLSRRNLTLKIFPGSLRGRRVNVPGDISAAAPFIAAALLAGVELKIKGVGLNPTRLGFVRALRRMGARLTLKVTSRSPEPTGDITVRPGFLRGVAISASEVPAMIDELPALAVLAATARGKTTVRGAGELRHKESDRVRSTLALLRALGAKASFRGGALTVNGGAAFRHARVSAAGDHRIAMAAATAALAGVRVDISGADCVSKSYPDFLKDFSAVFG